MTEGARIVACRCIDYPIKTETVREPADKQNTKKVKAGKQSQELVQCPASSNKKTQEAVENLAEKIDRTKPDKPCKAVSEVLVSGKVSLFKDNKFQVFVSIGLNFPRLRTIVCVFEPGTSPNLILDGFFATCRTFAVHLVPR